ncbi:AAA family ATPase [Bradyrhizobium liaoningense]|uniref:AAA family ATPase n=1 Tax=Bradyrhizobium liaoningense TaxID=43992 RepID=UPI001BA63A37|nr:AAA family ATPase [Bradyrhizobium liaoningense]MBR1071113.1 AAA family ATPase [Bradyrhizobium liaoningense]
MTISIFPPRRGAVPPFETPFALKQDNWNDYGFQTLYHLYRRQREFGAAPDLVGAVKILRRGQTTADYIQIQQPFEHLDDNFCSVGTSLDYYQRLNEIPPSERNNVLAALRDVVAAPELQPQFRDEPGWTTSLFRDDSNSDEFLSDARAILTGNLAALANLDLQLAFHPANWDRPLALNFNAPEPLYFGFNRPLGPRGREGLLPRRLIAIIGRNGSGKSTLLSRIARVAFAAPSDRSLAEIRAIGTFQPPSVGFTKIIAISYSAFDNFIVPGLFESEVQQTASDIEKGSGRYVYVGLRDIVAEVRDDLGALEQRALPDNARTLVTNRDRQTTTKLKSLSQLADEFERLIQQIAANGDNALLDETLEPLFADPSFADIDSSNREALLGSNSREAFLGWSTGHKIALHVAAAIVAHATRKSLILFDEPEMHLHPPLTAALMHALRIVLEKKDAFAILATHSPVILQETLARHVRIIRRIGDTFDILAPRLETFGENVGTLAYDAFGLTAASTDYHKTLDLMIETFSSVDEINALFTPALSGQALAYVMAGLARKAQPS